MEPARHKLSELLPENSASLVSLSLRTGNAIIIMPFNYDEYTQWCRQWSDDILQEEYQKYVKMAAKGSSKGAVGIAAAFFTGGISLLFSAPYAVSAVNAGCKVQIIKDEMESRNKKNELVTRKRDVFGGLAWGATGLITTPASMFAHHALEQAASSGASFYHGSTWVPSRVDGDEHMGLCVVR